MMHGNIAITTTLSALRVGVDAPCSVRCARCGMTVWDTGVCLCGIAWTIVRVRSSVTITTASALPPRRIADAVVKRHHDHLLEHHIRSRRSQSHA